MSLDDLTTWVEDNKLNIAHWVTVDDLNHLKRGGRISATTAFFGGMLNIKPIIHVDNDGHLVNVAKTRGRKASMDYLLGKVKETCIDFDTVFIGHGDCPEDASYVAREWGHSDQNPSIVCIPALSSTMLITFWAGQSLTSN